MAGTGAAVKAAASKILPRVGAGLAGGGMAAGIAGLLPFLLGSAAIGAGGYGISKLLGGSEDPEDIAERKVAQRRSSYRRAMGMLSETESVQRKVKKRMLRDIKPAQRNIELIQMLLGLGGADGAAMMGEDGSPEQIQAAVDAAGGPGTAARAIQGSEPQTPSMLRPMMRSPMMR